MKTLSFFEKPSITDRKLSFGKIPLNEGLNLANICSLSCSAVCVCICTCSTCVGDRCNCIVPDNNKTEILLNSK